MASMNRNVNLEEINTDAFLGISYLKYQTGLQKIIFIGGILSGIGVNLAGTFIFHLSSNVSMLLAMVPLLIGVAFGCNYNEDLSLINYFKLLILKPKKTYYSKPVEDLEQLRNAALRIREEEELRKRQQEKVSDEAQRKLLIKMAIVAVLSVVIFILILVLIKSMKAEEIHHTVWKAYDYLDSRSAMI